MARGMIGKKVGMTQLFDHDGNLIPVTIISAEPNAVVQVKTAKGKDKYTAVKLAHGAIRPSLLTLPELGVFKNAGVEPRRTVAEFRVTEAEAAGFSQGGVVTVALFNEGARVNVIGTSKGKGFQGVVRRHGFKGAKEATHGTHEYRRHSGAIGMGTYPGRVFKGHRMGGHMGDEQVTVRNLKVIAVDTENNLIVIRGAVPGAANGIVRVVELAAKKKKSVK
jgi:large subunit ribosomal protein L3